jgi:hypothetical protein
MGPSPTWRRCSTSDGIIAGGKASPEAVEILRCIWIAGVIPLLVGVGLLINGIVVSKRLVEITRGRQALPGELESGARFTLRPANTGELTPPRFGVTEGTTRNMDHSDRPV